MKFLHSMLRVSNPEATVAFFQLLGLEERRRIDNEAGRFTLIFLGVPGDEGGEVELTYNWGEEGYDGGRNFGHLAYQVDDIYDSCRRLMEAGTCGSRHDPHVPLAALFRPGSDALAHDLRCRQDRQLHRSAQIHRRHQHVA